MNKISEQDLKKYLCCLGQDHDLVLLLHAYGTECSFTEAQAVIKNSIGKELNLPRKVSRYSGHLSNWGLIERINPGSPRCNGYKHRITDKGKEVLQAYNTAVNSISNSQPEFV